MTKYNLQNEYVLGNWDAENGCFDESKMPVLDNMGLALLDPELGKYLHKLEQQYSMSSQSGSIIIPRNDPSYLVSVGYGIDLNIEKSDLIDGEVLRVIGGMNPYATFRSKDIDFEAEIYFQCIEDVIAKHNENNNTLPWE